MKPVDRTRNLMTLLGWQGGTVHDACKEVGLEVHEFLYADADFGNDGPCHDFRRGYAQADDIAIYLSSNRGNLQYWLGCVAAVQNGFEDPNNIMGAHGDPDYLKGDLSCRHVDMRATKPRKKNEVRR